MPTKALILATTLVLVLAATCPAERPNDVQAVRQATTEFYKCLNALFTGDASGMTNVWSHADDVTYLGPGGGCEVGWDQVRSIWESQAALNLGGQVLPDNVHVIISSDVAIVQCREVGKNLDAAGQPLEVSIRATNIFRKENGNWKMISHHTDLLPFLNKQ